MGCGGAKFELIQPTRTQNAQFREHFFGLGGYSSSMIDRRGVYEKMQFSLGGS